MNQHRKLTALAAAGVVLIGPIWAAEAATRTFHDRSGDVRSDIDVTRVSVQNGKRLVLTARHDDLSRRAFQSLGYYLDVNRHQRGPEYLVAGGFPASDWNVYKTRGWRPGGPVLCPVNMGINYQRNITRFTLARSCLNGDRGRLRVSLLAGRSRADGSTARDYVPGRRNFTRWVPYGGVAASPHYVEFRSPSRNIACSIINHPGDHSNYNVCDIRQKSFRAPPRPRSCPEPYGWGKHLWVGKRGKFVCASEAATVSDHPPTLQYGDSKRLGHITCTSRTTGMVCRNLNTDHGYKLAREKVRLF